MAVAPFKRLAFSPHLPLNPLTEVLSLARTAEAAGFEAMCWGEGFSDMDPFQVLAALARETTSLHLGTAIASWARTPPIMAASATTLDQLSDGRSWLGLGTMPKAWNELWHGIEFSRAVTRMREYIEALRLLWTSSRQPANYSGSIFRIEGYARREAPLRERIPIYLAATMPQMTRLAGEVADGVILHNIHTLKYLRDVSMPALRAGAQRGGRTLEDIDIVQSLLCSISNDRTEAIHWAKIAVVSHIVHPYVHAAFDAVGLGRERDEAMARVEAGDIAGGADVMPDEMASLVAIVGTPDECRKQLADYVGIADMPLLTSVAQHVPEDFRRENSRRILETFALR